MNDDTKTAALDYAAALEEGQDDAGVTAAATRIAECLEADNSGDDFARGVLEASIYEEPVDALAVARVLRALFA